MDADFCIEALKEALAKYGKPKIFNTDQGSQFTSGAWIDVLTDAKISRKQFESVKLLHQTCGSEALRVAPAA